MIHSDRDGVYLEFVGEPGYDLLIKSLEKRTGQAPIRLMTVRVEVVEGREITFATVFVPLSQRQYFLKKITQYAQEEGPGGNYKNAPLIESISHIRHALLESFWQSERRRIPQSKPEWIEVWLGSEDLSIISEFRVLCAEMEIPIGDGQLSFPERTVILILANREQLIGLIGQFAYISELRASREVATFFLKESNRDQAGWVANLLERVEIAKNGDVSVLILDHGVNRGHPLLQPLLSAHDCHAVKPEWGSHDHHGHGTLMAGVAAFGDLLVHLESQDNILLTHMLESAKILPPPPAQNPRQLWGYFMVEGISRCEIQSPQRQRIVCMAVTSADEPTRGKPSSWSGAIDEAASGYSDEKRRLIILAAGNIDDEEDWKTYPQANATREVQDPAQAWNALTVGAFTEKIRITDPDFSGYVPVAEAGDLSPYSSTSLSWPSRRWPIKPEVLFEGGNVARSPLGRVEPVDDLSLISTNHIPFVAHFRAFDATSAASAQAACMAAKIQAAYPEAWPETVRALIVHSAEWTSKQVHGSLFGDKKADYAKFVRVFGYGVPNLERALYCATNSLTLIAQAEIQPFSVHESQSRGISKDMHLYRLPWPRDALQTLGAQQVKMRITLSYFVEPSPGEVGWTDRYRYASHALRFDVNRPEDDEDLFLKRINKKAREEEEFLDNQVGGSHWTIGEARDVGSIHSDIWTGTASQLAASNLVAIYPAIGWWRERRHLGRCKKRTRYSLVISVTLPGQDIDIYTPVAIQLGVRTPIPVALPV